MPTWNALGESGGITDLTYAELAAAIGASALTPGAQYRITDFATTHYIVDANGDVHKDPVAQVETLTLTGTSGTANVTIAGGLTKLITWNDYWNDIESTAIDFVTAHAAAYLVAGIVVTSDGPNLIFTANVAGTGFDHPAIVNVTGDLGLAVAEVSILTLTGTGGTANVSGTGALIKLVTFASDLPTTAANFVTAWSADYLVSHVILTSNGADLIFTASVAGEPFVDPGITNVSGDLSGSVAWPTPNGFPWVNVVAANDDPIVIGPNEPLIVTAVAANKLHVEAKSALHPEDVIHYDWDPTNWLSDLSFAGDEYTLIDGFKGVITWRHDTLLDNYAPGDWRHCKSRRWKTAAPNWRFGIPYDKGAYVTYTTVIYKALQASANIEPTDATYWVEMISLVDIEHWNAMPGSFNGIASSTEFADFVLYAPGLNSAVYERCVRATHWEGFKDDQDNWDVSGTLLGNNVVFLSDKDYYTCYSNEIGAESFYNSIGANFYNNSIGKYFYNNSIGATFQSNSIGANFYFNSIGANFQYNSIGATFQSNSIGATFQSNSIGANFYSNSIGASFCYNSIGANFYYNSIGANFQVNRVADVAVVSTDFTSATHVYASYNCELFKRSDEALRLSYYDASDVLTVVAATA